MRLALYKGSLAKCIMQNLCQLANNMHEKRNLKFVLLTVPRCGRLAVMDPPPPSLSTPNVQATGVEVPANKNLSFK